MTTEIKRPGQRAVVILPVDLHRAVRILALERSTSLVALCARWIAEGYERDRLGNQERKSQRSLPTTEEFIRDIRGG